MKCLKTYEEFIDYYPGDYCLIRIDERGLRLFKSKLIEKSISGYYFELLAESEFHYMNIRYSDIIRRLTPEEIDEFEFYKNVNKYNV